MLFLVIVSFSNRLQLKLAMFEGKGDCHEKNVTVFEPFTPTVQPCSYMCCRLVIIQVCVPTDHH